MCKAVSVHQLAFTISTPGSSSASLHREGWPEQPWQVHGLAVSQLFSHYLVKLMRCTAAASWSQLV